MEHSLGRLRWGIVLFVVSWLPIAQIALSILHDNGKLASESSSQTFRLIVWGIQIVIGLIGVWLAGAVVIQSAKADGWRRTPKKLWSLFWHGTADQPKKANL